MTMMPRRAFTTAAALITLVTSTANASARFDGGLCATQGNWLSNALQQADLVTNAIRALKDDPSCKALVAAVERSPRFDASVRGDTTTSAITSYANFNRELSALSDYMRPAGVAAGVPDQEFRDVVYNVVFNKTYDAVKNIGQDPEFQRFNEQQRNSIMDVGLRMQAFLRKSEEIATMTMATAQNIVKALPESKLCLDKRPSEAVAIFSSVVHASASLLSGGRVNGVGEFLASLMTYSREMHYINKLVPLERARFEASVSCLIESTSEAYCAMEDAEDALDFMKGVEKDVRRRQQVKKILANGDVDPVANPLGGLIILMRDVPRIQTWMQKILFGIDPRDSFEGRRKNSYWTSLTNFIMSLNSLQADFRDKEQMYLEGSAGKPKTAKLAQLLDIHSQIMSNIIGQGPPGMGSDTSFYTRTRTPDQIRFFLIGMDSVPAGFNPTMRPFDSYWEEFASGGTNGFADPDKLLQTMKARLWSLMDGAKAEANAFFAQRMVVDPQNLVAEAMKGPGISPYQGFHHLRTYYSNLAKKLAASAAAMTSDPELRIRRKQILAQIPMLRDSTRRLDKIISSLDNIAGISEDADQQTMVDRNREAMNVVYDTADMLVSRDSFFGSRMQTALQADLSDTLWNNRTLNPRQSEMLFSVGSDIVVRLASFFGNDPILQRTDLSQAKVIHIANLKSVEGLFARVMFKQIIGLHCQLAGGVACQYVNRDLDPVADPRYVAYVNDAISKGKMSRNGTGWAGLAWIWAERANKPTEDSFAHKQLLAKLCVQTLAFESRESFAVLCKGTKMISEFSDSASRKDLDLSYDDELAAIRKARVSQGQGRIDRARGEAVCSLRSYIRKNHIYQMYKDYLGASLE